MKTGTPSPSEAHRFLVHIPAEPPRRLTPRVWLAWLVHSVWTRGLLYLSILPVFLAIVNSEFLLRALRDDRSLGQLLVGALLLCPAVALVGALIEGIHFARLVIGGTCVVTRVRAVSAESASASLHLYGTVGPSSTVTDTRFEYQGGRDGVNIQGAWSGRIRHMRHPVEGQAFPVLFDRAHPERRLVLWAYGLTTNLGDPARTHPR